MSVPREISRDEPGSRALRVLMLVLLLGSLPLLPGCGSSYGKSEYQKFKESNQVFSDFVAKAGGKAVKEGKTMHGFQMTGWLIDLTGVKITEELIAQIVEVGSVDPVFQLNLSKSNITDEQLVELDAGKVLQKTFDLDLSDTSITDAGLDQLLDIHCLGTLNLKGTKATKDGATRLGQRKIDSPHTPQPFRTQPEVEI